MRKNILLTLLLLVGLMVFSACQADTAAPEPTQAPAAPAPDTSEPAATAPVEPAPPAEPKTLTVASGTDVENMNIHLVTSSPSYSVLEHIYETLFAMSVDGVLEPMLAESIEPG
jgi:ABC-type transport system substrate-binding protein